MSMGPKIELRGGLSLWRAEVIIRPDDYVRDSYALSVIIRVPDRERPYVANLYGGPISTVPVIQTVMVGRAAVEQVGWGEFVRDSLRRAVLHEVDESLWIDGKQCFDPHGGEKL